jgi:hypothetical protein
MPHRRAPHRDVIGKAVHVMRILTGQITDDVPTPEDEGKDPQIRVLVLML